MCAITHLCGALFTTAEYGLPVRSRQGGSMQILKRIARTAGLLGEQRRAHAPPPVPCPWWPRDRRDSPMNEEEELRHGTTS